jgi:hypothetical protein
MAFLCLKAGDQMSPFFVQLGRYGLTSQNAQTHPALDFQGLRVVRSMVAELSLCERKAFLHTSFVVNNWSCLTKGNGLAQ